MSAFNGAAASPFGLSLVPASVCPEIATLAAPATSISKSAGALSSAGRVNTLTAQSPQHISPVGVKEETFGGQLFNKVIVTPRLQAFGFVLSTRVFTVDVWNSFLDSSQILVAINVTGQGGLLIGNAFALPTDFGPFQDRTYQATLPGLDPATQINNDAVWVFQSGIGGADVLVTGTRVVIWSAEPDWSTLPTERTEYFTQVMRAYGDNEQRVQLRKWPRTRFRFVSLPTLRKHTAYVQALLLGWQALVYGVPFWPDAQPLQLLVNAGAFTLTLDTTHRRFASEGIVMIWRDVMTMEALSVQSVTNTTVVLSTPTTQQWLADGQTYVVPVLLGRLPGTVDVSQIINTVAEYPVEFECNADTILAPSASWPTQYKGFNVFDIEPNADIDRKFAATRSLTRFDGNTGVITQIDRSGVPTVKADSFAWLMDGRAEVDLYRQWVAATRGALTPFWVPTWNADLEMNVDTAANATTLVITHSGFTLYCFNYRPYLCFIMPDATKYFRKVLASVDNGATETLTLDAGVPVLMPAASTMISYLLFCRMANDDPELTWENRDCAEAVFDFVELPQEEPA